MRNRHSKTATWLAALLVLLNGLLLPLGGKCIEPDGRLCPTCPDTPCPLPTVAEEKLPAHPVPLEFRADSGECDKGGCHYITIESAPTSRQAVAASSFTAVIPYPPAVPIPTPVVLPPPPAECRANGPPPRIAACPVRSPRAPPFLS